MNEKRVDLEVIKEINSLSEFDGLEIKILYGKEVLSPSIEVSKFRIKYFRDYPYLYDGNMKYESHYMEGFSTNKDSMLITVTDKKTGKLVVVSTGMPFSSGIDILEDAILYFKKANLNPDELYYYGEVIIDYAYRGRGLVKYVYKLQDEFVKNLGYKKTAIATVKRSKNDSRKPNDYVSTDPVWEKMNYQRTNVEFEYEWPTFLEDGHSKNVMNPMSFWIKGMGK